MKWYESRRLWALVPPYPSLKVGFSHEAGAPCGIMGGGQHSMRGMGPVSLCGTAQSGDALCLGAGLLP